MRHRQGFTLIELILVIAILALMAAIALPRLGATTNRTLMRSTAYALAQELTYAQQQAIATNSMVNFELDHETGAFRVVRVSDASVLKTGALDARVGITAKGFPAPSTQTHTIVNYRSTGAAENEGAFYLSDGNTFIQVRIAMLTGKAVVEEW